MMPLSKLLDHVSVSKMFQTLYGQMVVTHETMIKGVQYDSRLVGTDDLFVAIRGGSVDGNTFTGQAVAGGAKAVVTDSDSAMPDSFYMHSGVVKIVVPDARAALAHIAANFYQHPARKLSLVGVTGTNGKTTTTHIVKRFLEAAGYTTGLVGTIGNMIGDRYLAASHTTPESLELHRLFRQMVDGGCRAAVMEVSSHALHQHRVEGLEFAAAVFTNLTQDHLDYHGTMEQYFAAKRMLFEKPASNGWSIINIDDVYGRRLMGMIEGKRVSYGTGSAANVRASSVQLSLHGARFHLNFRGEDTEIVSPLVGRFNVDNLLAGIAAGLALGLPIRDLKEICASVKPVPGRFEQIVSPAGWIAIVDYAHTPDALEKALQTIHAVKGSDHAGRIITIFGCGGNRDAKKRPIMGRIAVRLSDEVVVTSDNPRHENPEHIIDDIFAGIDTTATVRREADRANAIRMALDHARAGDVVLVAGKGHEDYQIIGDQKIHCSDREMIQDYIHEAV